MARPSLAPGQLGELSLSEHPDNPSTRRWRARGRMRLPDSTQRDPHTGAYAAGPRVDVTGWGRTAKTAEASARQAAADRLTKERNRVEAATRAVETSRQVLTVGETLLQSAQLSGELSPSTVAAYSLALNSLRTHTRIASMDIAAVRPSDVALALSLIAAEAGKKSRAVKGGAGSAKMARSLLNRIYGHALAMGWVDTSPVRDAPSIRSGKRRQVDQDGQPSGLSHDRALTREERVELAWKVARSERAKRLDLIDPVLAGLALGCRVGELAALRWQDVQIIRSTDPKTHLPTLGALVTLSGTIDRENGKGLVRRQPKTESSERTIPVPRRVAALLARRARDRGLTESELDSCSLPVFPNPGRWGTGQSWRDRANTTKALRTEFDAAGFPWLSFHGLRRSAVTALADHLPIRAVADYAGHSSVRTTLQDYIGRAAVSADVAKYL